MSNPIKIVSLVQVVTESFTNKRAHIKYQTYIYPLKIEFTLQLGNICELICRKILSVFTGMWWTSNYFNKLVKRA